MNDQARNYSAYRLVDIKVGILESQVKLNISRMPKHQELIDIGMRWLSKQIVKHGGSEQWGELLELEVERLGTPGGRKPPGWWTEIRILTELNPFIQKYNRMPTAQELNGNGRGNLTNAINRGGGFQKFADMFDVPKKRTSTSKGERVEKAVAKQLSQKGFTVELTSSKCPYDILVNNSLRVDVKMATNDDKEKLFVYSLRDKGLSPTCDVYALCRCGRSKDIIYDIYFVPALVLLQQTVSISGSPKWTPWRENYEVLRNLEAFLPQI